jgi:hypothetical protein
VRQPVVAASVFNAKSWTVVELLFTTTLGALALTYPAAAAVTE